MRQAGPQVEYTLGGLLELLTIKAAGAQFRNQGLPGALGAAEAGVEEEVGAGSAAATATFAVPPKCSAAGVSRASVIVTPSKPRRLRSSPAK